MSGTEYTREPWYVLMMCLAMGISAIKGILTHLLFFLMLSPWRIVDDCGGAFVMGVVGGSVFTGIKGYWNAPSVRSALLTFTLRSTF